MWGKVHICETHRGWNTSHHFLHEFTLWPQLSTQWAGTEGCVRAWLINYRLLGNVLLGSKQWLHRWHLSRHSPILWPKQEGNVQAPRNCTATCKWESKGDRNQTHLRLWCEVHLVWIYLSSLRWKRRPEFSFWPAEQRKNNNLIHYCYRDQDGGARTTRGSKMQMCSFTWIPPQFTPPSVQKHALFISCVSTCLLLSQFQHPHCVNSSFTTRAMM